MGKVQRIIIGSVAKAPLHEVETIVAEAGRGLVGDRYHAGCGSFNAPQFDQRVREVTLIAAEAIEVCNDRLGTAFSPADFRRNIVTEGIDVMELKGVRIRIGKAWFRVVRSAPPCRYLSRLLDADMRSGLKGIGGVRAVIERSGTICVGDVVDVLA